MADRDIDILTKAASNDLLTLEEAKLYLKIDAADTSQDDTLALLISTYSAVVADKCHRYKLTFGKQKVLETWREIGNGRLFLSQWPAKLADLISVTQNGTTLAPGDFKLEEESGKLSHVTAGGPASTQWIAPVAVHYSGGYTLPDEAPLPLKHAVAVLIREERMRSLQAQTAGVRQMRHKEAMVSFFDPNALLAKMAGAGGKSPAMRAVDDLLIPYIRIEV